MVGYLESAVRLYLHYLPIFPERWNDYFYEYFNHREVGYSREDAKRQAMKMTIWKHKKSDFNGQNTGD